METPPVGVLIAVRNEARFIERTIRSVLSQTYSNFEVLVIDDASTDNTVDVLSRFVSEDRLRVVRNSRNLGQGAALNVGIDLLETPLIARLDGNDVCHPDRLRQQVERFGSHDDLALLSAQYDLVDQYENRLGPGPVLPVGSTAVADEALYSCPMVHSGVMFRRDRVKSVGGYGGGAAEDWDLWARMIERWPADNLSESLVSYRVMGQGISVDPTSRLQQRRQGREIMETAYRHRLEQCGPEMSEVAMARNRFGVALEYFAENELAACQVALVELSRLGAPPPYNSRSVSALIVDRAEESATNIPSSGDPESDVLVRLGFIEGFFSELARANSPLAHARSRALSHMMVGLGTKNPSPLTAGQRRNLLLRAIAKDPRWMRNRGVLRGLYSSVRLVSRKFQR